MAITKYTCLVCGYVYDSVHGDPDQGIAPGTLFDDLPDDWTCPKCGAPLMDFTEVVRNTPDVIIEEEPIKDEPKRVIKKKKVEVSDKLELE